MLTQIADARPPALPTWTDQVAAWSTFATAVLTLALVLMALAAWRTAKATLVSSRDASDAAKASADAALAANKQAQRDSIEQTRPFVYVELIPGLAGRATWDIRIANSGRSSARELVLAYDTLPAHPDDVAESLIDLFATPRTVPPGCSIRAMWRLEGNFDDGSSEAGFGKSGKITVRYTSDDPSHPNYADVFDVMIERSGLWPVPEEGPTADGLTGEAKKFYRLAQVLTRRVGELSR